MTAAPILRDLRLITPDTATGPGQAVLARARAQVGFIPNMYAAMANAPALLQTYLDGYARFREESGFSAAEQEVVFLAISEFNGCHYCTAAHSMIADKVSGVPADVLHAIRSGAPIADARLAALHTLATDVVRTRGRPGDAVVEAFRRAGFTEVQFLYVILAAAVKTLSNYSNRAFATPLDDRFSAYRVA